MNEGRLYGKHFHEKSRGAVGGGCVASGGSAQGRYSAVGDGTGFAIDIPAFPAVYIPVFHATCRTNLAARDGLAPIAAEPWRAEARRFGWRQLRHSSHPGGHQRSERGVHGNG